MCTLMTIARELFNKKQKEILERIKHDASINSDGYTLVLFGDNDIKLHSQSIKTVITLLTTTKWSRMFLHCRAATTGKDSISDTHGWTTQTGEIIMHNGILRSPESNKHRVDSQYIVELIDQVGIDYTIEYLHKYETYANVFIIDPEKRKFFVSRSVTNSLHTDGKGNYSTREVVSIKNSVNNHTRAEHKCKQQIKKPKYGYYSGIGSGWDRGLSSVSSSSVTTTSNQYNPAWGGYESESSPYLDRVMSAPRYVTSIEDLRWCESFPDFYDLVLDEGWHLNGAPKYVIDAFTKDQYNWYQDILKKERAA